MLQPRDLRGKAALVWDALAPDPTFGELLARTKLSARELVATLEWLRKECFANNPEPLSEEPEDNWDGQYEYNEETGQVSYVSFEGEKRQDVTPNTVIRSY